MKYGLHHIEMHQKVASASHYKDEEVTGIFDQSERVFFRDDRRFGADTTRRENRVNVRISSHDLDYLQQQSLMRGIPCHSFISSIIHEYVKDQQES